MKERWVVRLLVDRDVDVDVPPILWDWSVEWPANVEVIGGEVVGIVSEEGTRGG